MTVRIMHNIGSKPVAYIPDPTVDRLQEQYAKERRERDPHVQPVHTIDLEVKDERPYWAQRTALTAYKAMARR